MNAPDRELDGIDVPARDPEQKGPVGQYVVVQHERPAWDPPQTQPGTDRDPITSSPGGRELLANPSCDIRSAVRGDLVGISLSERVMDRPLRELVDRAERATPLPERRASRRTVSVVQQVIDQRGSKLIARAPFVQQVRRSQRVG
jgi:uncharacterized NAD-dependent epimerase/dehydratase family protein